METIIRNYDENWLVFKSNYEYVWELKKNENK